MIEIKEIFFHPVHDTAAVMSVEAHSSGILP